MRGTIAGGVLAGVVAGTVATAAQMLAWWSAGTPVLDTLLRDARLTAAIVMGSGVLDGSTAWRWDVMGWATAIHFGLSVAYALPAWPLARRLRRWPAAAAGAAYGLAIYGINLYGFTLLFPWFEVARGPATLLAHAVFGLTLAAACRLAAPLPPARDGSPARPARRRRRAR